MPGEVLYYVHHHGDGHQSRARAICEQFAGAVTLLSSRPRPADLASWAPSRPGPPGPTRSWVQLASDVWPDPDRTYRDPDAGGRLHWAPIDHPGLQDRNATMLTTVHRLRPALLVADVSIEIAVLARLSGVPVVVVLLPGRRDDAAHRLALDLATAVLAPWPRPPQLPDWLRGWESKIRFTGGIRGLARPGPERALIEVGPVEPGLIEAGLIEPTTHQRTVVAAFGAAGPPAWLPAAAATTPGWRWDIPTAPASGPDWQRRLAAADVVVAHAGLGTIADLASARARSVVLPQERPFGEQRATGSLLRQLEIGNPLDDRPAPDSWARILDRAASSDPVGWSAWGVEAGATAAAALLAEMAG